MAADSKLDDDIIKTEDGLIFNPYNSLNTEITLNDVQSILTRYGLPTKVHNIEFYRRAFVHRSYTKRPHFENLQQNITIVEKPADCLPLSSKSNERLEYIGDGVLELTTKYELYRRFPKEDEGFMTEKKIRTNLKKLGCLFEAFVGALFHDYNKMGIKDDEGWFNNFFCTGPGFQMAQKFIENVFKKHVNWTELIRNDDNYKNILQVKIQKEFKVTPHYVEIEHDVEEGYKMGVYLCLGQAIHNANMMTAIKITDIKTFKAIQENYTKNGKIFVFMGSGQHKIKRKAEQMACMEAIDFIKLNNDLGLETMVQDIKESEQYSDDSE